MTDENEIVPLDKLSESEDSTSRNSTSSDVQTRRQQARLWLLVTVAFLGWAITMTALYATKSSSATVTPPGSSSSGITRSSSAAGIGSSSSSATTGSSSTTTTGSSSSSSTTAGSSSSSSAAVSSSSQLASSSSAAVPSSSSGVAGPFTPLELNWAFYFDADDPFGNGTVPTNGSKLLDWTDLAHPNNTLRATSAATAPVFYQDNSGNASDHNSVYFNGSGQFMQMLTGGSNYTYGTGVTVFIVVDAKNLTTGSTSIVSNAGTNTGWIVGLDNIGTMNLVPAPNTLYSPYFYSVGNLTTTATTWYATNTTYVLVVEFYLEGSGPDNPYIFYGA